MAPRIEFRTRRIAQLTAQVGACVAVLVSSVLLLGSCAGERPSLGALAPKVPASTTTSTVPATSTPPPVDDLTLDRDDLQGWIATPVGDPEVYRTASTDGERIGIGPKTGAGAPTTFAVIGDASPDATPAVAGWYRVALPTRPNGSTGWVPVASVQVTKTPMRIFVDLTDRTLRVEEDGDEVFETDIAIGTTENPTPVNGTYVTELIANTNPKGSYGPYAFGLAMHSDTLSEFGTGDGQVGIHGTNQPQLIGQAVSHGCVRLTNADVKALVDLQLPLGVPVIIDA